MSENVAAELEKLVQKESELKSKIAKWREELDDMNLSGKKEKQAVQVKYLNQQIEKAEEKIKKTKDLMSKYRWENAKTGIVSLIFLIVLVIVGLYVGDQLGFFSMHEVLENIFNPKVKELDVNDQIREMMKKQQEEFEYGMKHY